MYHALLKLDLTRNISAARKWEILQSAASHGGLPQYRWWEEEGCRDAQLPEEKDITKALNIINKLGIKILTAQDMDYPAALLNLPQPPLLLFIRGQLAALKQPVCAIVGTRHPSPGAEQWSYQMAKELAASKITVISGGAMGIDAAALTGGLKGGRPPVVVLGVAINQFYPKEEAQLQQAILEAGGLIMSEYSPGRPTQRAMFLARNRLIAALSQGVLMSSSGVPSGALSTAAWAARLGRPLLTLPLSPWETGSAGNMVLLRGGAICVSNCREIIQALSTRTTVSRNLELPLTEPLQETPEEAALSAEEKTVMKALATGPLILEELLAICQLPLPQLSPLLLTMEMSGYLEKRSDGRFVRR